MTAQYRPYRDEDGSDSADHEHLNWTDSEGRGSIQIYEKTTEDLPFGSNKRFLASLFSVVAIAVLIGFLIGFFSHSHSECSVSQSVALNSVIDADLHVREKILKGIDRQSMRQTISELTSDARLPASTGDLKSIRQVVHFFQQHNLDKVQLKNYSVLLSLPNRDDPNVVQIVEASNGNRVIFSTQNESERTGDWNTEFIAYSPSGDVTVSIRESIFSLPGLQINLPPPPNLSALSLREM